MKAWWAENIAKNFHKSWSWLVSVVGAVVAYLPDLINLIIASIDQAASAFPTLDVKTKFYILAAANVAAILLRPVKQKSMRDPS